MATPFEFATATRVRFGAGVLAEVPDIVSGLGARRVLLVTGRARERAEPVREALRATGRELFELAVTSEPTVELARAGAQQATATRCEAVVAVGGGSAMDLAKAVAALATNRGDPRDYLEVIGRGRTLERPSLPVVAIPTTAGTGSEVTRNAVLLSRQDRVKVSLRSPLMLPVAALVDPDMIAGAPASVLVASGLDALSQLIEPFISARANPLTDALSREGIRRSARAIRRAVLDGADASAREDLALASLLGGLCLANAGLGAVHGIAAPAGGLLEAPHGAICAALLAPAMAVNLRALELREPANPSLARFQEIGGLLTGRPQASAEDGVTWLEDLRRDLGVAGLGRLGLVAGQIPALVERAKAASSMKGNPLPLTDEEIAEITTRALWTS
jgi:alcohol dehydrogenase class IV